MDSEFTSNPRTNNYASGIGQSNEPFISNNTRIQVHQPQENFLPQLDLADNISVLEQLPELSSGNMASVSNDGNDFDYEDIAKASDNDMDLL